MAAHLDDVRVFVQVVDSGSFTAAARQLGLSKAVISKYVSRLEDALGARLLNRSTRKLSLTEAGDVFYRRSRDGLGEIEAATAEVSRHQDTPTGTLRLNAPMSFGVLHLASLVARFMEAYPGVTVDLELQDRQLDIIDEGFDVSLRIAQLADSSLVARRLGRCRHVIAASPDYLERHGEPRNPDALREHAVLGFRHQRSAAVWHFEGGRGRRWSVPVTARMRSNNSLALREALLAGAGLARIPTFVVGDDLREGGLRPVLRGYRLPEPDISLVYAQRHYLSAKVEAFVGFVLGQLREPFAWDRGVR